MATTVEQAQQRVETFDEVGIGGPLAGEALERCWPTRRGRATRSARSASPWARRGRSSSRGARRRSGPSRIYYGTWPQDYAGLQADVLGHFAVGDPWEPESRVREQEQALRQAGVDVEFHRYAEAKHWFAERDRPEYHAGVGRGGVGADVALPGGAARRSGRGVASGPVDSRAGRRSPEDGARPFYDDEARCDGSPWCAGRTGGTPSPSSPEQQGRAADLHYEHSERGRGAGVCVMGQPDGDRVLGLACGSTAV